MSKIVLKILKSDQSVRSVLDIYQTANAFFFLMHVVANQARSVFLSTRQTNAFGRTSYLLHILAACKSKRWSHQGDAYTSSFSFHIAMPDCQKDYELPQTLSDVSAPALSSNHGRLGSVTCSACVELVHFHDGLQCLALEKIFT